MVISGALVLSNIRRLRRSIQRDIRFLLADMLAPERPPADMHNAFDWVIGVFIRFVGAADRARQFSAMSQLARLGDDADRAYRAMRASAQSGFRIQAMMASMTDRPQQFPGAA
jgi:hypothetical protein